MIGQMIQISKEVRDHFVTLFIKGTINTETASELNKALLELDYNGLDLTIDFQETEYITSAGLRALLIARKKLTDDTMHVIHANKDIEDVFSVTGFDSLIRLEKEEIPDENYRLSFSSLLKKRLASDAGNTAYIYKDRIYTWMDVEMASQIIADDLASRGVRKGSHVGLCAPNSVNWVFTLYAIQKLGGIAVLMNPALRPFEVCSLAEISETTHLCYAATPGVTTFEQYEACSRESRFIRSTYDISDSIDFTERFGEYNAVKDLHRESFHADDACVIIFSSGSTGKPKAILSSAYNLMAGIEPLVTEMHLKKNDINLAFLPMFHIFGFTTGISGGLLTGYYSVIPEGKSPDTMIRLIDRYKCTVFNSVPTMMLAVIQMKSFTPEKLSSLRLSILGGSATTEDQLLMLRKLLPGNHFGNIYGMSENAAVSLTGYEDSVEHITRSVGRPINGLELIIRDPATGEVLPVGERGEICIRSKTMVICYYKLPIENQPVDDEGWLATGDLGVLDEEGYLHIVGRIKDLIICGGENISPGEIADVLAAMPEIADVKVLGIPDAIKGEIVAAAVILKPGAVWDEEKIRSAAAERLAKYKLPVHYAVMDSFPLLGSGKVDAITLKQQITEKVSGTH